MHRYDYEDDPDLAELADRMQRERAVPAPGYRGALRRRLLADLDRRGSGLARPRLWVAGYAGSGAALLMVAAVGLAGVGPFGA
jgi:hypothetical protein